MDHCNCVSQTNKYYVGSGKVRESEGPKQQIYFILIGAESNTLLSSSPSVNSGLPSQITDNDEGDDDDDTQKLI